MVSCSTDGKILLWALEDKLNFPIKGHLLSRKLGTELQNIGGTSLDVLSDGREKGAAKQSYLEDNTFIVGAECGSIYKFNIS